MMAERSSCVKVTINCRRCRKREIERCSSLKDYYYCDNCAEIKLCNSNKKYFDVKEINVLSELLKDRKNKFLFVGEGNFSFTVAFNAYRQYLLPEVAALERPKKYCWYSIVMILIFLLQCSITKEAVKIVYKLLQEHQQTESVLKSVSNVVKCLKEASSENQRANAHLDKFKSCLAINYLAVEYLIGSIQEVNKANEYLLKSIREMKIDKPAKLLDEDAEQAAKNLRKWSSKMTESLPNLFDRGFIEQCRYITPFVKFDELICITNIKYRHVISLITVDYIVQKYRPNPPHPPIDIISSCYEKEPYEKTIRDVRDAMCSGSGDYRRPSENIVRELRAADCTNIHQISDINFNADPPMYGINARSIPPEIARWSNLVWFQCPWTKKPDIPDLILGFLKNAADNCFPGTYVCVGITTKEKYMYKYNLDRILRDCCTLDHYVFLGVDDVLINELLSYGYKHESKSDRDIHNYIRDYHVTLVFRLSNNDIIEVSSGLGELSI